MLQIGSLRVAGANIELIQGDITKTAADVIVNAANSSLADGGGVDGAIHRAGGPSIMEECRRIGRCPTGSAVITSAGRLNAKRVVHAVAPRYRGKAADAESLASAYHKSMLLAEESGAESIAFPSLGTGAYGYPINEAAAIALEAVAAHLQRTKCVQRVIFVLFTEADATAYARALAPLAARYG